MSGRLTGKVCLITGTGGSMGRAAALRFAAEGASIVGCDINAERAEAAVDEVRSAGGDMISLHPCDLTDEAQCQALVDAAVQRHGRIDVLFNNAAMAYFGWIDAMPVADWTKTIDQELNLVYLLTKAAWPALTRSGGSIINTASVSAWQAYKGLPGLSHAAAKGGVLAMTRQLAMEGALHGLRANSISPGLIATHQTAEFLNDEAWAQNMLGQIMLGRAGTPDEVAHTAVFLASDESSFITGTDIRIDGGTLSW